MDGELLRNLNERFRTMSAFMSERITHELMAGSWPAADQDLGQGRPLLEEPDVRMSLRLEGTRSVGNGVVALDYSGDPGS
ncbi:hypothetical protein [Arthrobacter sp. ISL-65]|uniref:hypothetical protein n=1 Tax=Arthrobacter sp. ISL-65 TaxID=2819112 RepID=UPI002035237A|nr:hypothetical protein [Arthrobacter sp. ISL-65]